MALFNVTDLSAAEMLFEEQLRNSFDEQV